MKHPSTPVKWAILFVASYVLLYLTYAFLNFLPKWDAYGYAWLAGQPLQGYLFVDPLFLFIPLIGFSFMVLTLDAGRKHFNSEFVFSVLFALGFTVLSYAAFYVALVVYYWNNAYLNSLAQGKPDTSFATLSFTMDFAFKNFWDFLLQSPFFVLILSALLGWASFVIVHKFWVAHPAHAASSSPALPA